MIKLLIFLIPFSALAEVIHIKKGEPAPEDGYFVTVAQEKKFRAINEENVQLKRINIQLKDLALTQDEQIGILKQRIANYQEHNEYLLNRVNSSKNDGFWNKTIYFLGGVGVMTGATYLSTRVNR